MRYLFFVIGIMVSGLIVQPVLAVPIPMADVPAMAQASDLIVVGRATQTSSQSNNGRELFLVTVDRVLKGAGTGPAQRPLVELNLSAEGYASVQERQYGIFFLRQQPGSRSYVPTDPFHPALFASPLHVPNQPNPTDALGGLAQELAGVLTASVATLTNPVSGVHDIMIGTPADQAQDVYYEAARALTTLPLSVTGPALQSIAASNQVPARLWAMYSLFLMADFNDENAKADYLAAVAPVLVNPQPDVAFAVSSLGDAIEGHFQSPKAIPTLATLLGSTEVSVRRAAASVLSNIATSDVVAPLAKVALNDDDEYVRLFAVQGLAKATGTGKPPTVATFRQNADGLLQFWHSWAASNVRGP